MKKLFAIFAILCFTTAVYALPGVSFSEGAGGRWDYTADGIGQGVFTFIQPIEITNVIEGGAGDPLVSPVATQLYIPGLYVENLVPVYAGIYQGEVSAASTIQIKDGGTVVMEGTMNDGAVVTVGSAGNFYSFTIDDIDVTLVNPAYNASAFIGAIGVGSSLDFVLTLNRFGDPLAEMIMAGEDVNDAANAGARSVSGSIAVPEPATLALLGLGGLLLRRKK